MKQPLLSTSKDAIEYWDYDKNGLLTPECFTLGSEVEVWWKCPNGHSFKSQISDFVKGNRCPYCSGHRPIVGETDLERTHPHLLNEWDYDKNSNISPNDVTRGSDKKVWWKCSKCGFSYQMAVSHKTQGCGCPACSGKQVFAGVNDLATVYPEIASEWDYEKNSLKPNQYVAHSNKKVWWKCKNGHSWFSSINSRYKNGRMCGCPYCNNIKVQHGYNDLDTMYPHISKYWCYEKNEDSPQTVYGKSNKKVWWKCEHGHVFKRSIFEMTKMDDFYCPICSNTIFVKGLNDLATKYPEIAKEWDYERNGELKPNDILCNSSKMVWWVCSKNSEHRYRQQINRRTQQNIGCPYCTNQKVCVGDNDLSTKFPEIKRFWDYAKNKTKPEDYAGLHSNKIVWFICEKGHSYKASISSFTSGKRCPVCSSKIILPGFNDLCTTHPSIAKEWDYEKNKNRKPTMYSRGSDTKVWWKCERNHSYLAAISSRVRGTGCPICAKEKQSSLPEKALFYYIKQYFTDAEANVFLPEMKRKELDIFIPSLRVGVEYDGMAFHQNFKRDLAKDELCDKNNIQLIRIREKGCAEYKSNAHFIKCGRIHNNISVLKDSILKLFDYLSNISKTNIEIDINLERDLSNITSMFSTYTKEKSLEYKYPEIIKIWNNDKNGDLKPSMVSYGSNKKVWWVCPDCGYEWIAPISSVTRNSIAQNNTGCPYCNHKIVIKGKNDLKTKFPNVAKEWDYEKNTNINIETINTGSTKKVWWKCVNGHSWQSSIVSRTRLGTGCPICCGKEAEKGKNDLETLFPGIAKEWDYEKNGNLKPSDVKPGSERKVWWICPKGHSYQAFPRLRTVLHTNCPYCSHKKPIKGVNDLKTLHPELAKEWDYEKNGDLKPEDFVGYGGSHKRIWWKCEHGHSWCAVISSRVLQHTGCPICAKEKRKNKNI